MVNRFFVMAIVATIFLSFDGKVYCVNPFKAISDDNEVYFYREGTGEDIAQAQEHYIAFHERRYSNDADREFQNPREEITARFALNIPLIESGKLQFFVLKKWDHTFSGYSIVHVDGQTIYSIQTAIYIKGVGRQFKDFLQAEFPSTKRHIFFVWKPTVVKYPDMKRNTNSQECDDMHPFLSDPSSFYEQQGLLPLSESYQGFEQILEN